MPVATASTHQQSGKNQRRDHRTLAAFYGILGRAITRQPDQLDHSARPGRRQGRTASVAIDCPFLETSTTTGSFGLPESHAQPETVEAVT
jgi:hypothetical protein